MNSQIKQRGSTLIECLIGMVITTIGLLAAAGLIGVALRLQTESRDAIAANALARAKMEELQNYMPSSGRRARGGGLNRNVNDYNDSPDARFRRRWQIETRPADHDVPAGTQRITVVVVGNTSDVRLPPIEIRALVIAQ